MSQELKVSFTDKNNKYQYDGHAERIKVKSMRKKGGKLFLGDRQAVSMVQLKHRKVTHVVNADVDQHMLCREENIHYCKIDPIDDKRSCLEKAFKFIDDALEAGQNTLITCHTGYGKSAAVLLYYLMKRDGLTLADAHRHIEATRPGARSDDKTSGFRPDLVKLLQQEEKYLYKGQAASTSLQDRTMVYKDGKGVWTAPFKSGVSASGHKNSRSNSKSTEKKGNGGALKAVAFTIAMFMFMLFFIGAVKKFIDKKGLFR